MLPSYARVAKVTYGLSVAALFFGATGTRQVGVARGFGRVQFGALMGPGARGSDRGLRLTGGKCELAMGENLNEREVGSRRQQVADSGNSRLGGKSALASET